MSRAQLLQLIPLSGAAETQLHERYEVHRAWPDAAQCADIRAVVTNGSTGLNGEQMASLPSLRLVHAFGAGYENVDVQAARSRGIAVSHAPGMNDATVADHALGLMLALSRGYAKLDAAVRAGQWNQARSERHTLSGAHAGIIGLGNIGAKIAARCAAFDMRVSYHTRTAKDVAWTHQPELLQLAREADFLIVACPGGPATRHLVNAAVLDALGADGYLVNIARGSVVDTAALTQALLGGRIAGAGLDVIENEPEIPAALLDCERVIFTPHIAGRSPAAITAQGELLLANIALALDGKPVRHALA
jgi:D-3-phosphoglycerate dehydrogenase